jgi:hypothetical protein
MLDSVRVYGNAGGAHPGEITLKEQPEVVPMLMFCINHIIEEIITLNRSIDHLYETLLKDKRRGIETRDRNAPDTS